MPISNIYSSALWAISGGQHDISVTIARQGGRGWASQKPHLRGWRVMGRCTRGSRGIGTGECRSDPERHFARSRRGAKCTMDYQLPVRNVHCAGEQLVRVRDREAVPMGLTRSHGHE